MGHIPCIFQLHIVMFLLQLKQVDAGQNKSDYEHQFLQHIF
jgi:hypothetical protein